MDSIGRSLVSHNAQYEFGTDSYIVLLLIQMVLVLMMYMFIITADVLSVNEVYYYYTKC
jgi:hypothetical protein